MYHTMLLLPIYLLCTAVLGREMEKYQQRPFALKASSNFKDISGDSIVKLCPESRETDLLVISSIANHPQPILNEEIDVYIWGYFTRDISPYSTLDIQINITANTGDFGAIHRTDHICDWLEEMHQPPHWNITKACPPSEGIVFINYAAWFADWLVAPGNWSVKFDAKTPEGDRIYCLQAEFDLQCPPERDDYRCLRNTTDTLDIPWMVQN